MRTDPQLRTAAGALATGPGTALIIRGADLVYLAESFQLGLFLFATALTAFGSLISILFASLGTRGVTMATLVFAALGLGFAALAIAKPRRVYPWLRYSPGRQLAPLGLAMSAVLFNGPDSPSWWVALPLLWVMASVGKRKLALTAALLTAGAYIAGTLLGGEALVHRGDAGILAAAVALAANTLVFSLVTELFARFILRLHQLEADGAAPPPRPLAVPNLATAWSPDSPRTAARSDQEAKERLTKLSTRELEVALLLRDGLSHAEIALALGITTRQVERHLMHARERAGAQTAGELLAMLVTGRLAPV